MRDISTLDMVIATLRYEIPTISAIDLFGSHAQRIAQPDSDVDLAFLADHAPDPVQRWELAGQLSGPIGSTVNLVDLCAASTVLQYQVITRGRHLCARDGWVSRICPCLCDACLKAILDTGIGAHKSGVPVTRRGESLDNVKSLMMVCVPESTRGF